MQLMNMAGVVASPNCATLTPWLAIPATMEVSSNGPDSLESLPICEITVLVFWSLSNCAETWMCRQFVLLEHTLLNRLGPNYDKLCSHIMHSRVHGPLNPLIVAQNTVRVQVCSVSVAY